MGYLMDASSNIAAGHHAAPLLRSMGARRLAPRQVKVVELRYFGGLTEEEIVTALEISPRTVRRDWDFAKAWLLGELNR